MSKQLLSNIDQLLGLNLFQNQKCSEFIEISPNRYFKYVDVDFKVRNKFMKYLSSVMPKLAPTLKMLRIRFKCQKTL